MMKLFLNRYAYNLKHTDSRVLMMTMSKFLL